MEHSSRKLVGHLQAKKSMLGSQAGCWAASCRSIHPNAYARLLPNSLITNITCFDFFDNRHANLQPNTTRFRWQQNASPNRNRAERPLLLTPQWWPRKKTQTVA